MEKESNMVRLGGLWKRESKAGDSYYTGPLGIARLVLFKNKAKRDENDPELVLFIAQAPKDDHAHPEKIGGERVPR